MSVVPLRISDIANASGKPRTVPGTINVPYGYRLSQHRQTRPNVNLTYGKQSRLSEGNKSLPTKYLSNQAKGELSNAKDPPKEEHGKSMREKDSSEDKNEESVKTSDTTSKAKSDAFRSKTASKVEKPASVLPGDSSASIDEDKLKEERDYKNFLRTYDFVERTDKKILAKRIRFLVDEGIAEYEKSIDIRREKLRQMLLAEEKSLMREVVDQAQRGADSKIDETQRRTAELKKRSEEQRIATVTEKRMRQYLTQCPEARKKFTKKTTLETKYSNLVQIVENEAKRQAEKEVDMLWYKLMLKEVEAKKAREIEEERRRAVAEKSIVTTLEKQIAGKLALCEEEKKVKEKEREHLERLLEDVRREESLNPAREREKRLRLKRDLEEQLSMAKRFLEERACKEKAMEDAFRLLSQAELSQEKDATSEATIRLRHETMAYMSSLEKLREDEALRNAEVEAIIQASAKEVEWKLDLAKQKSRENRERMLREVMEGREQQLKAKRATKEEENKRTAFEDELRKKETEAEILLEAQAEMKRRETAVRYGQELKAQQKFAEETRRHENEKAEKMDRENLEREKEYEKLMEQMLNAPEIITPHAFKILLKECATRREAEQKGLCYCPRSSTQPQSTTPSTSYP